MGEVINKFFSHCKRVAKADIVKVFSFTVVYTLLKLLSGLLSVKVVASVIGPAGIALLGQLNNFTVIVMTLANGGINNGIVKYIAEYKEDRGKVIVFLSTALRITLFCSLIIGLFMILFHTYLSKVIMLSSEYGYVFTVFGLTVLMYSLNMMLISVINGFKEFRMYVKISIANSVVGVLFTLVFVYTLGLKGALISAVTYQSVMLCVTFLMVRKLPWVDWEYFKKKLNILVGKKYFRYSLMTLVTTTIVPISQMFLRGYVISEISVVEAGWWEGMNRISNMYLMVITSSFSVYYLPRLSELTDEIELRREIFKAYSVIMPMLLIGFSLVYFLRHFIISMLFTPDFYPMENLFLWQLLGDFFKICSWLLAFLMIAKSMMKTFIFTEIIFAGTFVGMSLLLIQSNGIIGITQAYVGNYILYLITMFFIFRKMLSIKKR